MTISNSITSRTRSDELKKVSSDRPVSSSVSTKQVTGHLVPENPIKQKYYTVAEVAEVLEVDRKTIRRWDAKGKIKCIRTAGGHRRIPTSEILRLQLLRKIPHPSIPPESPVLPTNPLNNSTIRPEKHISNNSTSIPHHVGSQGSKDVGTEISGLSAIETPPQGLRAIKNQLKILKILTTGPFIRAMKGLILGWLVQLIGEMIDGNEELQPLREAWSKLQAAIHEFDLQNQDHSRRRTLESLQNAKTLKKGTLSEVGGHMKKGLNKAFLQARQQATNVFWKLYQAQNNATLPDIERERARRLIQTIITPYQRLTRYLVQHPVGTLAHDVCKLLLTARPKDYGRDQQAWSVRNLAYVCKTFLQTTAASKSQIHRFLRSIHWYRKPQTKLLSSDINFGEKMKALGHMFLNVKPNDCLAFGDAFDFTSRKVKEYLHAKYAPAGLQTQVRTKTRKYYQAICTVPVFGLLVPLRPQLETAELPEKKYDVFLPLLISLLEKLVKSVSGTVYLVLDNAPYHKTDQLPQDLQKIFKNRVKVFFLPTYSPELNPIEKIWHELLEAVDRYRSDLTDLKQTFQDALACIQQRLKSQSPPPLKLRCAVCQHKFEFTEKNRSTLAHQLETHLCFTVPHLNPYTVQILTHALEINPL